MACTVSRKCESRMFHVSCKGWAGTGGALGSGRSAQGKVCRSAEDSCLVSVLIGRVAALPRLPPATWRHADTMLPQPAIHHAFSTLHQMQILPTSSPKNMLR